MLVPVDVLSHQLVGNMANEANMDMGTGKCAYSMSAYSQVSHIRLAENET